jgi:rhodanese-related sulfurtransferase
MKKFIAVLALAFAAVFALSACTSSEPVELGANAVIIDVRTPEEYATGHLDGAVNIDVQSPDFGTIISQLPTDGEYFVYCRSGNRSGQAIAQMEASGFTDLTNGGSVAEASSMTGIPVVK